jgi:hypothetical protein
MGRIASPWAYRRGLSMMSEVLHRGGLTTVGEQGFPQVSGVGELMLQLEMLFGDAPFRFVLVPSAMYLVRHHGDAAAPERAAAPAPALDRQARTTEARSRTTLRNAPGHRGS